MLYRACGPFCYPSTFYWRPYRPRMSSCDAMPFLLLFVLFGSLLRLAGSTCMMALPVVGGAYLLSSLCGDKSCRNSSPKTPPRTGFTSTKTHASTSTAIEPELVARSNSWFCRLYENGDLARRGCRGPSEHYGRPASPRSPYRGPSEHSGRPASPLSPLLRMRAPSTAKNVQVPQEPSKGARRGHFGLPASPFLRKCDSAANVQVPLEPLEGMGRGCFGLPASPLLRKRTLSAADVQAPPEPLEDVTMPGKANERSKDVKKAPKESTPEESLMGSEGTYKDDESAASDDAWEEIEM